MNVILHLGGNPARAQKAAKLARAIEPSLVVVSSEEGDFYQYYDAAGIDRSRVIINDEAWDTVSNLTHTHYLLKQLNCERLFVVTDLFHCQRSILLALISWGLRVPVYVVSSGLIFNNGDERFTVVDCLRMVSWRLFGLLVFSKEIRRQRQPNYESRPKRAHWEVGV